MYNNVEWKDETIRIPELAMAVSPPYEKESFNGGDEKSKAYIKSLLGDTIDKFNSL